MPPSYGLYLGITTAITLFASGCSSGSHEDQAPGFELKSLDGRNVSLSEFKGKVVLINFWAVGCMPCRMEMPHLRALHETYSRDGFTILAVNAWDEPPELVKTFVEASKLPFAVLLNGGKVFKEQYKGSGIPMGVLIDAKGRVAFTHVGFDKEGMQQLDKKLKQLMG